MKHNEHSINNWRLSISQTSMLDIMIVKTSKETQTKIKHNIKTLQEHHISCKAIKYSFKENKLIIVDEDGDALGIPSLYAQ